MRGVRVEGGLSGVLLTSDVPATVGITQGCSAIGPVRRITKATGNVVLEIDGRPAPVKVDVLHLGTGSFGLSSVIWKLGPSVQISIDNLFWFTRAAGGSIGITAVSPHAPLTEIPAP